jgi:glutaredoxin
MTPSTSPFLSAAARLCAAALLLGAAGAAVAQYKIVGPDGRVTYTDKPPTAAEMRSSGGAAAASGDGGALPYEVRKASGRYPVTLYATKSCEPCDSARKALRGRGVPFSEYTIDSAADVALLQSRFGDQNLPVITIGTQTLKGYRGSDIDSYLDVAGYPKQAKLNGYSWPAPVALAPAAPTTAKAAPTSAAPSANGPKIDLPPPSQNGIQF